MGRCEAAARETGPSHGSEARVYRQVLAYSQVRPTDGVYRQLLAYSQVCPTGRTSFRQWLSVQRTCIEFACIHDGTLVMVSCNPQVFQGGEKQRFPPPSEKLTPPQKYKMAKACTSRA